MLALLDAVWVVIAIALSVFSALAVVQLILWRLPFQIWLHGTANGRRLLGIIPWKQLYRESYRQRFYRRYGRVTARTPIIALAFAAFYAFSLLGGCTFAWLRLEATADSFSPWSYIDAHSDLSRAAMRARAAFGAPPSTLAVLATACDGRSVLDGATLQPLVRLHNGLVTGGGSQSFADVCARVGAAAAGSGRSACAFDSILALANPAAVEESSTTVDSSSHHWVPPGLASAASLPAKDAADSASEVRRWERAPYEPLVRALLRDAPTSRGAPTADGGRRYDRDRPAAAAKVVAAAAEAETAAEAAQSLATRVPMGSRLGVAATELLIGLQPPLPMRGAPPYAAAALSRYRYDSGRHDSEGGRLWMSARGQVLIAPESARARQSAREKMAALLPPRMARVVRGGKGEAASRWEAGALNVLERLAADASRQRRRAALAEEATMRAVPLPRAHEAGQAMAETPQAAPAATVQAALLSSAEPSALSPECIDVAWDSDGARASDMLRMRLQLLLALLLWLPVVVAATAYGLAHVAPLLTRPLLHGCAVLGCVVLASCCGVGVLGWLSWLTAPSAAEGLDDADPAMAAAAAAAAAAASLAGTAANSAAEAFDGGVYGLAMFSSVLVLPVTLDAAFVLAAALDEGWREAAGDVSEERFATALSKACPRLIAAAVAGAAVPAFGAFALSQATSVGLGAPTIQLAVATSVAVLSAHALVLSLFWGGIVLELRSEVRA